MIFGLTGWNCSGKDWVADFLVNRGFVRYSLSDALRESLTSRGVEIIRDNMINEGIRLRSAYGEDVLAARILPKLQKGNYVVVSIRRPEEVVRLKINPDFRLVYVRAGPEVRLKRCLARNRENDPKNMDDLLVLDAREANNLAPGGQQIEKCIVLADYVLDNDFDDYERLKINVENMIKSVN